ncbi:MAG: hypothetical protein B6244_11240 [Candidatus Cloacimonetes bacterium 4572_55]|nr:MAG: hypothetical protein B6244_11240 [Candidatus Cloacimonetes bacterium 4572_55]
MLRQKGLRGLLASSFISFITLFFLFTSGAFASELQLPSHITVNPGDVDIEIPIRVAPEVENPDTVIHFNFKVIFPDTLFSFQSFQGSDDTLNDVDSLSCSVSNDTLTIAYTDTLIVDSRAKILTLLFDVTADSATADSIYILESDSLAISSDSLCAITIQDSLTLRLPLAGETWPIGVSRAILWSCDAQIDTLVLEYSPDNGESWNHIAQLDSSKNIGFYTWSVPSGTTPADSSWRIRVRDMSDSLLYDVSGLFSVDNSTSADYITITGPNGGEEWAIEEDGLNWDVPDSVRGHVDFDISGSLSGFSYDYSSDAGASWITTYMEPGGSDGDETWRVRDTPSDSCLFRVTNGSDSLVYDISDDFFTIIPKSIQVTSPVSSDTMYVARTFTIEWEAVGEFWATIEYSFDAGQTWTTTREQSDHDRKSTWHKVAKVPGGLSDTCLVRISEWSDSGAREETVADTSDFFVTIDTRETKRAIIVAGQKSAADNLWGITDTLTNKICQSLLEGGYFEDEFMLLHPEPTADYQDTTATLNTLRDAIVTWADSEFDDANDPDGQLYIYIGGQSARNSVYLNTTAELLSADSLASWVHTLEGGAVFSETITMLDFCYAGSFLDAFGDSTTILPAKDRIVIAASDTASAAYFGVGGYPSFSYRVINEIFPHNHCITSLFEHSRVEVDSNFVLYQEPVFYYNGRVYTKSYKDCDPEDRRERPVDVAPRKSPKLTHFNRGFTSYNSGFRDVDSQITAVIPDTTICESSLEIWADVEIGGTNLTADVDVVILPPGHTWPFIPGDYDAPIVDLTSQISLLSGQGTAASYRTLTATFDSVGVYQLIFRMTDSEGDVSYLEGTTVTRVPGILTLIEPNGGESFSGDSIHVAWEACGYDTASARAEGDIRIEIREGSSGSWQTIADHIPATDLAYSWEIPEDMYGSCFRIRIVDENNSSIRDVSDECFSISGGPLTLDPPSDWSTCREQTITFTRSDSLDTRIDLSLNRGASWDSVTTVSELEGSPEEGYTGSYSYTPSVEITNHRCQLRVVDVADENIKDTSSDFTIYGKMTVMSPNGGGHWQTGTSNDITWLACDDIEYVKISYGVVADEDTIWHVIRNSTQNDSVSAWSVPDSIVTSMQTLIKIEDASDPSTFDISDGYFKLLNPITLLFPNGDERLPLDSEQNIRWIMGDSSIDSVMVEFSHDDGDNWDSLAVVSASEESWIWTPGTTSVECLIKVSDADSAEVFDVSDNLFEIIPDAIRIISPEAGDSWSDGVVHNLEWAFFGDIDSCRIEYRVHPDSSWHFISEVYHDTTYAWTVPNTPSNECELAITALPDTTIADTVGAFSITNRSLNITAINFSYEDPDSIGIGDSLFVSVDTGGEVDYLSFLIFAINGVDTTWQAVRDSSQTAVFDASDSTFSLFVPPIPPDFLPSNNCWVRAFIPSDTTIYSDMRISPFIRPMSVIVITPVAGDSIEIGSVYPIVRHLVGRFWLGVDFSSDGGECWQTLRYQTEPDTVSYWNGVFSPPSDSCLIRVYKYDDEQMVVADSSGIFTTYGPIEITSGENDSLLIGSTRTIHWNAADIDTFPNVKIEYAFETDWDRCELAKNRVEWIPVTNSTLNDSTYEFTVPDISTPDTLSMPLWIKVSALTSQPDSMRQEIYDISRMIAYKNRATKRAIIVAGQNSETDPLWQITAELTNNAFGVLRSAGYQSDEIGFLSPDSSDVDQDEVADQDTLASLQTLRSEILGLGEGLDGLSSLLFYITGPSSDNGRIQLDGPSDYLIPDSLDTWLDELESEFESLQTVIALDFSYAEAFIDSLADSQRVVIASSDSSAYFGSSGGNPSFGHHFMREIYPSHDLWEAFANASRFTEHIFNNREDVDDEEYVQQNPILNYNGENYDSDDEDPFAEPIYLAFTTVETERPDIIETMSNASICEDTVDVWVEASQNDSADVAIIPPNFELPEHSDFEGAVVDLVLQRLAWQDTLPYDRHHAEIADIQENGSSRLIFRVWDRKGQYVAFDTDDQVDPQSRLSESVWDQDDQTDPQTVLIRSEKDSLTLSICEGWNLIGMPLALSDNSYSAVFPYAVTAPYSYSSGEYSQSDYILPELGYWLKSDADTTVQMIGCPDYIYSLYLTIGWNLISPPVCNNNISVQNIEDPEDIIGTVYCFTDSAGYESVSTLYSGQGYWILASGDGDIVLDCANETSRSVPADQQIADMSLPELQLSSNAGDKRTLYLNPKNADVDESQFVLPPAPMWPIFDVRVDDQDVRSPGSSLFGENRNIIEIQSDDEHYPITIRLQTDGEDEETYQCVLHQYIGQALISTDTLSVGETLEISDPAIKELIVDEIKRIPNVFALDQNYPNPFNPSTTIQYQLPISGHTTLKIYNVTGQLVKTLVDRKEDAGYKSVPWSGLNDRDQTVSSGVYFYQLKADGETATARMVLLK